MKSICFVIPYFGKLPGKAFQLWLSTCRTNSTVNWILFTDDKTEYDYPENVKPIYCTYQDVLDRIQSKFDEKIVMESTWHLAVYKPCYGEVFADVLEGYDFWGFCDIDLVWGNIRKFYNDEVLEKYERISFLGHSQLFKNTPEVNARYRTIVPGKKSYKDIFYTGDRYSFDENGMDDIYDYLGIDYFKDVCFANLTKYETKFHLDFMPDDEYKNHRQVFTLEDGKILRHYLHDGEIHTEEYLYIHFWCRPMSYKISDFSSTAKYLIYSDVVSDKPYVITKSLINRKGISHPISFYAKSIWQNRKKLTPERIIFNIKGSLGLNK